MQFFLIHPSVVSWTLTSQSIVLRSSWHFPVYKTSPSHSFASHCYCHDLVLQGYVRHRGQVQMWRVQRKNLASIMCCKLQKVQRWAELGCEMKFTRERKDRGWVIYNIRTGELCSISISYTLQKSKAKISEPEGNEAEWSKKKSGVQGWIAER